MSGLQDSRLAACGRSSRAARVPHSGLEAQASEPVYSASAPDTTSMISRVIAACRTLFIVRRQRVDHFRRVLRGVVHRHHLRRVLRGRRLEQRRVDLVVRRRRGSTSSKICCARRLVEVVDARHLVVRLELGLASSAAAGSITMRCCSTDLNSLYARKTSSTCRDGERRRSPPCAISCACVEIDGFASRCSPSRNRTGKPRRAEEVAAACRPTTPSVICARRAARR